MPEREHTKFGDDEADTSPPTAAGGSGKTLKNHGTVNGVKRKQDGVSDSSTGSTSKGKTIGNKNGKKRRIAETNAEDSGKETQSKPVVVPGESTLKPKDFQGETSAREAGSRDDSARRSGLEEPTVGKAADDVNWSANEPAVSSLSEFLASKRSKNATSNKGKGDLDDDTSNITRPKQADLDAKARSLKPIRESLPIHNHQQNIRSALRKGNVLLIVGETGSGKSTQIPQYLMNEPWCKTQNVQVKQQDGKLVRANVGGRIAITEPRRVAATSLARRLADETGSYLGPGLFNEHDKVGYAIRFDTRMPPKAKIKFVTEGVLLQELIKDPFLLRYSCVIIDEIHERSIDVDLLAGFIKKILKGDLSHRGGIPLKVVIMSATANMARITEFFSTDLPMSLEIDRTTNHDDHAVPNGSQDPDNKTGQSPRCVSNIQSPNGKSVMSSNSNSGSSPEFKDDKSYSSWSGFSSDNDDNAVAEKIHVSKIDTPNADHEGLSKSLVQEQKAGAIVARKHSEEVAIEMISGKTFPVDIFYLPESPVDYIESALKTIFLVHTQEAFPGDLLVFLTGQEEIETVAQMVTDLAANHENNTMLKSGLPGIHVQTLYGTQPMEDQQKVFNYTNGGFTRRVVLATNIAETSVTVPGVRYVIDTGRVKMKEFRQRLGLQSLLVKQISKSSSIQRKGRAGREARGKCYRLYTEKQYLDLVDEDLPEILRSDIVDAVLTMKLRGVDHIATFPLMDSPEPATIERALFELFSLGAINAHGKLTTTGRRMGAFPLPAAYAKVLVASIEAENDCLLEAIDVISVLIADDVFIQPKSDEKREEVEELRRDVYRREGDIMTQLTLMQKYVDCPSNRLEWCRRRYIHTTKMKHAANIRRQLRQLCKKSEWFPKLSFVDNSFTPMEPDRAKRLLWCFMQGFPHNTAIKHPDGSYRMTGTQNVIAIHPSSRLHGQKPPAFLYLEDVFTSRNYAKKCSVVEMDMITELMEQHMK